MENRSRRCAPANVMDPTAVVFGSAACLLGASVALQNGPPLSRSKASRHWPATTGRVRSVQMQYYGTTLGKGSYVGCAPRIGFEYTVDGKQFERTAFVGNASGKFDEAQDMVRRYHSGKQVSLRYDPAHPARAVMDGEYVGGSEVLTFFGCLLCIVGILMIVGGTVR